jgi:hypothetical protein
VVNAIQRNRRRVFVAMPFRSHHDGIFATLKSSAETIGAELIRLDETPYAGSIISQIRAEIEGADAIVAVVSEENGNVYYEIGLAHCQHKPVALLTSDSSTLKFDLRDHRAIVYDPHHPDLIRDELIRVLSAMLDTPREPHQYIASVYRSIEPSPHAAEQGLMRAVETIANNSALGLQKPVRLRGMEVISDGKEMAVTVEDFMGTQVRAVIDINGIVGRLRRIDNA